MLEQKIQNDSERFGKIQKDFQRFYFHKICSTDSERCGKIHNGMFYDLIELDYNFQEICSTDWWFRRTQKDSEGFGKIYNEMFHDLSVKHTSSVIQLVNRIWKSLIILSNRKILSIIFLWRDSKNSQRSQIIEGSKSQKQIPPNCNTSNLQC